jgi:hypothetical protein
LLLCSKRVFNSIAPDEDLCHGSILKPTVEPSQQLPVDYVINLWLTCGYGDQRDRPGHQSCRRPRGAS